MINIPSVVYPINRVNGEIPDNDEIEIIPAPGEGKEIIIDSIIISVGEEIDQP